MERAIVKSRCNSLLVAVVVVGVAVVITCPGSIEASSRSTEHLYASVHELTNVLREGFKTLTEELRHERSSREEISRFLKTEVLGIRRAVQGLCRGVRLLSGGSDNACLEEPGGESVHRAVHTDGGTELAGAGGSAHPRLNVDENTPPREKPPPTGASPSPDPMSCPPPYRRLGSYCLTLLRERVNWEEARTRCYSFAKSRGAVGEGDLVVVDDMATFKSFVAETDFYDAPSGMALVGGSADGWGGSWVWLDGSLIKELPWLYSQSNHEGTVLAVDRDGIFHTIISRTSLWPLCQIK